MKRVEFNQANRSGDVLHVEVPGAIVNIRVNLHDADGNELTTVSVSPDDESRSPDMSGHYWHTEDADGNDTGGAHVRIVRQPLEQDTEAGRALASVRKALASDASDVRKLEAVVRAVAPF